MDKHSLLREGGPLIVHIIDILTRYGMIPSVSMFPVPISTFMTCVAKINFVRYCLQNVSKIIQYQCFQPEKIISLDFESK